MTFAKRINMGNACYYSLEKILSSRLLSKKLKMSRAHAPIFPLLHLRHSSFSNPSFASPTSQALHLTSPGEPPMSNRTFEQVSKFSEVCLFHHLRNTGPSSMQLWYSADYNLSWVPGYKIFLWSCQISPYLAR